jgi:hypothetical protein
LARILAIEIPTRLDHACASPVGDAHLDTVAPFTFPSLAHGRVICFYTTMHVLIKL